MYNVLKIPILFNTLFTADCPRTNLEHPHQPLQLLHEVLPGVLQRGQVPLQLVLAQAQRAQLRHQRRRRAGRARRASRRVRCVSTRQRCARGLLLLTDAGDIELILPSALINISRLMSIYNVLNSFLH